MALNRIFEHGDKLALVATHPTSPDSGQPCRIGGMTAVATTDERTGGDTSMQFDGVWDLPVKGANDAGNVAVAVGDALFYVDADIGDGTGFLSKKSSGFFFGFALEAVDSGTTTTVEVKQVDGPGPGTADILAGAVGGAELSTGLLDIYSADGQDEGSDATYTVTGVAVGDEVWGVLFLSTKAAVATVERLDPAGFTVTATDVITAGTPVDRSNDQLLFLVVDKT